ncbi:MAG: Cof-type HAD-IIB family hydrolase [Clostridiales bacterium]|nr:Cof-type HAD-IIB family hydrolase [Clostridiales bacterium]
MAVLDIDGTLVNNFKQVSRRTVNVISRLESKGVHVCLCTGRNIASMLPVARKLKLETPCICIDGSIMYDLKKKKIIYESVLPNAVMRDVIDIARARSVNIEAVTWSRYIWHISNRSIENVDVYKAGSFNLPESVIYSLLKYRFGVRYEKSLDKFYRIKDQIYQIVAMGEEKDIKLIQSDLELHDNKDIRSRILWGNQLFITGKNVSKSHGLKILAEHFGVGMEEAVAIGDDLNDLDMIEAAGMGVAMGNANESVKAVSGHVTKTNEEDGAALALEKFFFS